MPSVAIIGTRGYPSYYGGFETLVRHLAPYLADHDWDVTVYGRRASVKSTDSAKDARVGTVTTFGVDSKTWSTLSYGLSSSLDAALRVRPDVALVMNVANGFFLPLMSTLNIPTVVNVDGVEWERAKWGWSARQVFRAGAKMTALFATHLVFDAHAIKVRWNEEFHRTGSYVPYGADIVGDLPVEPGLAHRSYILYVARFVPENTFDEFLTATRVLAQRWPVVIVGSSGYGGPADARVAAIAREHANVHWLGHIADDQRLFSLWQHAGAYFHGHSVGGTNPALVQAMACGAPVVARDTVFNREVIGSSGLFVSPDARVIAQALSELLTDPCQQARYSDIGVQRVIKHYSWQSVNEAYKAVLDHSLA